MILKGSIAVINASPPHVGSLPLRGGREGAGATVTFLPWSPVPSSIQKRSSNISLSHHL